MTEKVGNPVHKNAFYGALAVYIGTAVGAGIFGIPYAMSRFGFIPSVIYLIVLTGAIILVSLFYGEVALRTEKDYQMVGYAEKYLGKRGKLAAFFVLIFGNYGALLAYAIGTGNFLSELLSRHLGGSPFIYGLVFFVIMSAIIFKGLKMVTSIELVMSVFFIAITIALLVVGFSFVKPENLIVLHPENFFLPYGVILFAMSATTVMPLMKKVLESNNQLSRYPKSIIAGALITLVIYLVFSFIIVGVTGNATSQEGIIGLSKVLGKYILAIGAIFGVLTMATSFLTLGLVLKQMYRFDYKIPHFWSWFLTCAIPLLIFLLGMNEFIKVVSIVGAVVGGLRGILIILMWRRAKKTGDRQPEYALKTPPVMVLILFLVFAVGIIYQLIYTFKK